MIKKEIKSNTLILTEIKEFDSIETSFSHCERWSLYRIEHEGEILWIIYDSNMEPDRNAWRYLNTVLYRNAETTRKRSAYVLREFLCWLSLMGIPIEDFAEKDFIRYRDWLSGISPDCPSDAEFVSPVSVNLAIGVIRSYFSFLGLSRGFLEDTVAAGKGYGNDRYRTSLKVASQKDVAPKHITPTEFRKLLSVIRESGDVQAELIVRLEYTAGLRIGEVLGLTYEDLIPEKDYVKVILRNRVSDRDWQMAKYRMTVKDRSEYRMKTYREDWKTAVIDKALYRDICDFIEDENEELVAELGEAEFESRSHADSVYEEDNSYVFLGHQGRPLTDQSWNQKLRGYFLEAGLDIDYGHRKSGLNHRLRHGFAMMHAYYREDKVGVIELMKLLRIRDISTAQIYFTMTEDEKAELIEGFASSLADVTGEI